MTPSSFTDADLIRAELRAKYERKGSLTQSRILPKSTADVHAAIAAIKARSTPSLGHEATYHDWSEITKNLGRSSHIMSRNKSRVDIDYDQKGSSDHQTRDDIDSDISSDLSSDDSSVETEEMVPTATRLNLAAYIDSLKNGNKRSSDGNFNQSNTNDTNKILLETNDESHLESPVPKKEIIDHIERKKSDDAQTTKNHSMMVVRTTPQEDTISSNDAGLQECVRKTSLLAEDVDCSIDDINKIILFAREKRYPTRLLLNTFCETRAEIGYNPRIDDVTIYCQWVGKAIDIVELGHHNFRKTVSSLISNVKMNNFDDSLIQNIIDHPDVHVRDRGDDNSRLPSEYHDEFGLQDDSFDTSSSPPFISSENDYLDKKLHQMSKADRLSKMENTEKVPRMSAVLVTRKLRKIRKALKSQPSLVDFKPHSLQLTTHERLQLHPGFTNVDSITETVLSQPFFDKTNLTPIMYDDFFDWKDVPISLFTNQKSVTKNNWFGKIEKTIENNRVKGPIITPAFGIPFQGIGRPLEWDEDWYTSWPTQKNHKLVHIKKEDEMSRYKAFKSNTSKMLDKSRLPSKPGFKVSMPSDSSVLMRDDVSISSQLKIANHKDGGDDDIAIWIGNIYVVKYRPGERMSRVHPEFTSFLHKSRWKMKYFPSGNKENSNIFIR